MGFDKAKQQLQTHKVSLHDVIGHPAFAIGMMDYHTPGAKFRFFKKDDVAWSYERGRLFAAATKLQKLKMTPKGVHQDMITLYQLHRKLGALL